jgi:transcriptional regulator with GAF, ATPase, and Fis domain
VAATHRDLELMVKRDQFRSDLYYRLNVFPITVPPLRERLEDIGPLVEHYVEIFSRRLARPIDTIPDDFIRAFRSYSWPGNIRELQNVIERAVILSNNGVIPNLLPSRSASIIGFPVTTKLSDSERTLILSALEASGWVVGGPYGAAARLGLKRTTLVARMKKHGILRLPDEIDVEQALNNKRSSNRVC